MSADKFGTIKNPLTIIAIFAGIAEASGTGILPFIAPQNQSTFIYFLITFPTVLIILFFVTLNFNNKALYAPSDFNNEENYIKIFKYDISKQENIQIEIKQDELLTILNENFLKLERTNEEKFVKFENELKLIQTEDPQKRQQLEEIINVEDSDLNHHLVELFPLRNSEKLKRILTQKGYDVRIYSRSEGFVENNALHKSIWLGYRVPLNMAKDIILMAKKTFNHLEYLNLSNQNGSAPDSTHDTIFIGGSTKTAIDRNLKKLSSDDFEKIKLIRSLKDLHLFIEQSNFPHSINSDKYIS